MRFPGTVLVCADSHTGAAGAFNCAARGIGVPDVILAATTGKTWFEIGETIRYELEGALQPGRSTKDVFLAYRRAHTAITSPRISSTAARPCRALAWTRGARSCTMGTELNAEFSIFEPDDRC